MDEICYEFLYFNLISNFSTKIFIFPLHFNENYLTMYPASWL